MSGKPDIARRVTGRGIERAQRALSVSDVHLTRAGVVADVVGIIKPLDALDARERSPVQDIDAVGAAVRDIDATELGQIENPLRLAESGDASFAATRPYVDDFQRVIAEGGDEKPLLLQVNPEVVDAPLHGRQAYGRSRLEHICRLRPGGQNKRQEWYQNQLAFRFHFVAPFSAQCQSQSQPQLPDGLVSVVSPANTDIERKTVPEAPDCADEPRGGPRAAGRLLAEHFGDRAHRPGMRAFEDGAQEKVGLVLARPRESRIEMHRYRFGALGYDAGDGKTRSLLPIYGRKQQPVFRRNARPGRVLQYALPQHLLDENPVVDDRAARLARLAVERDLALPLNHQFAIPLQAEVADHGRSDRYPFRALAPPANGTQLQLEFALLRNVGVR